MTSEVYPDPEQSSTRTGMIDAVFATPYVEPASVPATCVPCPLQSEVPNPSETVEKPFLMRPVNSVCEVSTPVSMTYASTAAAPVAYEYDADSGSVS
jgi:hypothetical protein